MVALAGAAVALLSGGEPPKTVTVHPTHGPAITVPRNTLLDTRKAASQGFGDHRGERKETISPATRRKQSAQAKRGTTGPDSPTPIVRGGSFTQPGCRTIPVRNYSSRGNQRPGIGVAHYWAAPNHPGWGDVLGVVNLFDNARYQASSNYVTDVEGHCAYSVPESARAWTQGNMNGATACSIEMGGDFNDYGYQGAGLRIAARIFVACFKRWGIPIRIGATNGCNITRTGLVDHDELACGNNHTDIRTAGRCPTSGNACVEQIVAEMRRQAGASPDVLLPVERRVADKRCYHRRELVVGHNKAENLKWARFYRNRILIPYARLLEIGGHVQLVTQIDRAKGKDHKPWSYRHRGARRMKLLNIRKGVGC